MVTGHSIDATAWSCSAFDHIGLAWIGAGVGYKSLCVNEPCKMQGLLWKPCKMQGIDSLGHFGLFILT